MRRSNISDRPHTSKSRLKKGDEKLKRQINNGQFDYYSTNVTPLVRSGDQAGTKNSQQSGKSKIKSAKKKIGDHLWALTKTLGRKSKTDNGAEDGKSQPTVQSYRGSISSVKSGISNKSGAVGIKSRSSSSALEAMLYVPPVSKEEQENENRKRFGQTLVPPPPPGPPPNDDEFPVPSPAKFSPSTLRMSRASRGSRMSGSRTTQVGKSGVRSNRTQIQTKGRGSRLIVEEETDTQEKNSKLVEVKVDPISKAGNETNDSVYVETDVNVSETNENEKVTPEETLLTNNDQNNQTQLLEDLEVVDEQDEDNTPAEDTDVQEENIIFPSGEIVVEEEKEPEVARVPTPLKANTEETDNEFAFSADRKASKNYGSLPDHRLQQYMVFNKSPSLEVLSSEPTQTKKVKKSMNIVSTKNDIVEHVTKPSPPTKSNRKKNKKAGKKKPKKKGKESKKDNVNDDDLFQHSAEQEKTSFEPPLSPSRVQDFLVYNKSPSLTRDGRSKREVKSKTARPKVKPTSTRTDKNSQPSPVSEELDEFSMSMAKPMSSSQAQASNKPRMSDYNFYSTGTNLLARGKKKKKNKGGKKLESGSKGFQ